MNAQRMAPTPDGSPFLLTTAHNRRDFLRRAGALGVAIPAAGALLADRGALGGVASAAQGGGG